MRLATITLKHFDGTLDKLTHKTAQAASVHSLKIKRINSEALPHFVLAAVLGFIFLSILLLLTV